MSDAFQLIRSNGMGNPDRAGGENHWVRVSDNPAMTRVDQLTGDGRWRSADCGEACVISALGDRGKRADELTVERDAGAVSGGTSAQMLTRALADFGVPAHYLPGTVGPGFVMNPVGGRVIAPLGFGPYAAASENEIVVIDGSEPWSSGPVGTLVPMTPDEHAKLYALWTIFFAPYGEGGTAPWSNLEVLRRQLADLGAPHDPPNSLPYVAPVVTPGSGLTPAQAAAVAQIPALAAMLTRIESALAKA